MDVAENILYTFDALHSGYAEVSKEECSHPIDTSFIREHCLKNSEFIEGSQNLIPLSHTALMAVGDGTITGPSYSLPYTGGPFVVNRDFVYGLNVNSGLHKRENGYTGTDVITGRAQSSFPPYQLRVAILYQLVPIPAAYESLNGGTLFLYLS